MSDVSKGLDCRYFALSRLRSAAWAVLLATHTKATVILPAPRHSLPRYAVDLREPVG